MKQHIHKMRVAEMGFFLFFFMTWKPHQGTTLLDPTLGSKIRVHDLNFHNHISGNPG